MVAAAESLLRCIAVLAALIVAVSLASAPTEPVPESTPALDYRLAWSAPPGCPEASAIEARIAELARGRSDGVGTLEIEGRVERHGERFELRLTTSLRGMSGTRELRSAACDELAESVALVVAVSLDPALASAIPEPQVPPRAEEDASSAEPEASATSREPVEPVEPDPAWSTGATSADREASPRPSPPQAIVRAGLGPELGALPSLTAAVRMAAGVGWPRARLMIVGTYLAPRRAQGPGGSAALYQQGMVAVLGCARLGRDPWSWPLCGGIEAGGLRADGRGLRAPRTVTGPWLGPVASVGVIRQLGRVGLWLELEAVVRGVATRVVVDDALAFRPSVASGRLVAGVELSFR